MTPNLASARQAIQAELIHARQGVEFYVTRVEALETALNQLESVEGDDIAPREKERKSERNLESKRGRKAASANGAKPGANRRGRKISAVKGADSPAARGVATAPGRGGRRGPGAARTAGQGAEGGRLPTTGVDFWLKLVTVEPQTAVEIANAAAREIGIKSDQKEQIQKLKQRVAPALATLVTAKKVQDKGAGRERKFFKSEDASA